MQCVDGRAKPAKPGQGDLRSVGGEVPIADVAKLRGGRLERTGLTGKVGSEIEYRDRQGRFGLHGHGNAFTKCTFTGIGSRFRASDARVSRRATPQN
jgi:hypothetical protein